LFSFFAIFFTEETSYRECKGCGLFSDFSGKNLKNQPPGVVLMIQMAVHSAIFHQNRFNETLTVLNDFK